MAISTYGSLRRSIVVQCYLVYIGLVFCKPHDKDVPCQWSSKTGSSFGELVDLT